MSTTHEHDELQVEAGDPAADRMREQRAAAMQAFDELQTVAGKYKAERDETRYAYDILSGRARTLKARVRGATADADRWRTLADRLAEAIRLTQEYIGDAALPKRAGWSWFDALQEYKAATEPERGEDDEKADLYRRGWIAGQSWAWSRPIITGIPPESADPEIPADWQARLTFRGDEQDIDVTKDDLPVYGSVTVNVGDKVQITRDGHSLSFVATRVVSGQ